MTPHSEETREKRIEAARAARQAASERMLSSVRKTLSQMHREGSPIIIAAVARRAGVSRTFLYQNPRARDLVSATVSADSRALPRSGAQPDSAAWKERAENAEAGLRATLAEISTQRATISELLGKIRDLEADLPEGGVHRILAEQRRLREELMTLRRENRHLQERLAAARDNNRFLDRRMVELEVEILRGNAL